MADEKQVSIDFERSKPFIRVVAMNRSDAAEWSDPHPCYAVDYVEPAEVPRYKFGAKVYRVWTSRPTPELRREWEAA